MDSYDSARYDREDIDTRFPPDISTDIDARFGVSTRNIINERYDSSTELEQAFPDNYQLETRHSTNRVGVPLRGIFDDV